MTVVALPGGPGLGPGVWDLPWDPAGRTVVPATSRGAEGRDPFDVQRQRALEAVERAGTDVVLCAHSAGCYAAVQVREAVPHALRAVVLLAGQATDGVDDPALLERRLAGAPPDLAVLARESAEADPTQDIEDGLLRRYLAADLALTEPVLDARTRAVIDELCADWDLASLRAVLGGRSTAPDLTARSWSADVPTLVLNGEADPWAGPASGRQLAALLPGAVAGTVEGAGHLVWRDAAAVRTWLDEIVTPGVAS